MMKRERMREKRPYGILAAGAAVLIACRLIPAVPWYAAPCRCWRGQASARCCCSVQSCWLFCLPGGR